MQKKDVIYIDVEDDITAIIGKIKGAKEKIVALVPPKRTDVLRSAVNLRLLARTSHSAGKRLVLITSNASLASLAASAKIPVAKTLQSPPRLADAPESDSDDEDDVIEGDQLPVGDHAGLKNEEEEEIIVPEDLEKLDMDNDAKPAEKAEKKAKSRISVPDFGSFRKKMTIGAGALVLLILFLVWANVIAPHANVIISAKTSSANIKTTVSLGDSLANDASASTLSTTTKTDKQSQSISFDATGTKQVGTKASGMVLFYNCSATNPNPVTVQAGTYISSGGMNYIVQSTVIVPAAAIGASSICGGSPSPGVSSAVQVVAADVGSTYNISSGTQLSDSANSNISAIVDSDGITGGDSHTATVVSVDDINKALQQLKQQSGDDEKKTLRDMFGSNVTLIDDSFTSNSGDPQVVPALGEEVKDGQQAKLTVDNTYTMTGVSKDALDSYLNDAIKQQTNGDDTKRVYDNGASSVQFSNFQASSSKKPATVQIQATGQVGLKIDDNDIKNRVEGKKSGEAIGDLQQIDGVNDVSVNLSPFWVQTIPSDPSKITIQFKLINNG